MKLLVVSANPMGPDGITNVICNLLRAMDKAGMRMDLAAINEPGQTVRGLVEGAGGSVFVLERSIKKPLRYINALRALIRRGGYDLVHAHGSSATLALEMTAAALAGCPVRIAHSHNTTCRYKAVHYLLTPLLRALCTHPLACGTEAGRWLHGKKEFTVVRNGIDTARFAFRQEARAQRREELGIAPGERLLGHVGYFVEAKNQGFLLDMMACMPEKYRLLLVGQGRLRDAAQQKARDLGVADRVIFLGVTDRVEDYLCACDGIVMPSLYEGLPLTLMEQQASGLKCLVSDRITAEADKTGLLTFLPLERGALGWARAVQAQELTYDRDAVSREAMGRLRNCGYDIYAGAAELRAYYERAART